VRERAEQVIRDILRPLVEADGGAIELVDVRDGDGEVVVRLYAACAGCPGAPYTTAHVVEPALKRALGDHIQVRIERAPSKT